MSHHGGLMSTLGDVIAQLRATLDRVGDARRLLLRGAYHRDDAAGRLAAALRGATAEDAARAQAHLTTAGEQVATALAATDQAEQRIRAYLRVVQGDATTAPTDEPPPDPRTGDVRAARRRLAARRLAGHPGDGRAHGVWVRGGQGLEDLNSGDHPPWFEAARAELTALGGPNGHKLARLARHVEVRLVVQLLSEIRAGARPADQPVRETVVMDRPPCSAPPQPPTPFSCHYQLGNIIRALLPAGSSLTVVDVDGNVWTYPKEPQR